MRWARGADTVPMHMRGLVMVVGVLLAAGSVLGQSLQPVPAPTAQQLVQEALRLQAERKWREALARHDAARQLQPNLWETYAGALDCYVIAIADERDPAQRQFLLQELRQRFQAALQRSQTSPQFIRQWSEVFRGHVLPRVGDTEQSRLAIEETRAALQAAEKEAATQTGRMALRLEQALLEVTVAHALMDEPSQRAAYERARELFESVMETQSDRFGATERELYAVSLLHVGRFQGETGLVHRAVQLLEEVVNESPSASPAQRYNLACAHAVAGNRDAALRELARALEMAPVIFSFVEEHDEWKPWRDQPDFRQLLNRYDPRVDDSIADARKTAAAASRSSGPAEVDLWWQAARAYQNVTELRPEDGQLWYEAAQTYRQAARVAAQPVERARWLTLALESYGRAAQFHPTWQVYHEWGLFLRDQFAMQEAAPEEQAAWLRVAVQRLEQALDRTQFTADRLRVQLDLAATLVRWAMSLPEDAPTAPLYERALRLLPEVVKREELAMNALTYHVWGLAHLELGRRQQSRMTLRQAVERFQTALQFDPENAEVRYNLACAYALLGDQEAALRMLRECLERSPRGPYASLLATDRDFDSIRHLPEFARLQGIRGGRDLVLPAPERPLRR